MIFHEALMSKSREWALLSGVPFVDVIHGMDQDRDQLTSYVHLSAAGNAIVARELGNAILARTLPCAHPTNGGASTANQSNCFAEVR